MASEKVIRRTSLFAKTAALCLAAALAVPSGEAEDGVTNRVEASTLSYSSGYTVGTNGGFNALIPTNGGVVRIVAFAPWSIIGNSAISSSNYATVTGAGSVWSNGTTYPGSIYIGNTGSFNQLSIANGGKVINSTAMIGFDSSSSNNSIWVADTGSVWSNASWLYVGYNGSFNQMTIANGGKVVNSTANIGYNSSSSNNSVLVTGTGAVWTNTADLNVGYSGVNNSLTITNNGKVSAVGVYIGSQAAASSNMITLAGTGSILTNATTLYAGYNGSFNVLNIVNGAISYNSTSFIGSQPGANSNVVLVSGSGSLWNVDSELDSGRNGSFNLLVITNSAVVSSGWGYIGMAPSANSNLVAVTGAGSCWTNSGDLVVGYWKCVGNMLTIGDSAAVYDLRGTIGSQSSANSNGVTVSGVGSLWNSRSSVYVGYYGSSNQLAIVDGGMVIASNVVVGYYVSTGNVISVTGGNLYITNTASSALDVRYGMLSLNSGTVVVNQLYLTNNASSVMSFNGGTLICGGTLISNRSAFTIGDIGTGATMNLVGGSHSFADGVIVGNSGSANSMVVTNGARARIMGDAYLGNTFSSSNNSVLVNGSGSVWSNSGTLYIGNTGSFNTLTIANGGAVIASNATVGVYASAAGNSITISGGSLTVTNQLSNGSLDVRTGTLALNTGTVVVNRLYLTNNAYSVMTFSAGLLRSGGSTVSNGVAFTVGDGASAATLDLLGGTHRFADGLMLSTNSSLIGSGDIIAGSATNFGTIAPGHSAGRLSFGGDLTLKDSSVLNMELGGTDTNTYDRVFVGGLLRIGGLLNVTLTNGYTGSIGDTFDLFSFSSETGTFSQTNLPTLSPGMEWNTSKLYTLGDIQIVPEPGVSALLALGLAAFASRRVKSSKLRVKS